MKTIAYLLEIIGKFLAGQSATKKIVIEPVALMPAGEISLINASSILLDVIDGLGDDTAEIYLPDNYIKIYCKSEVMASNHLKEVSAITYVAETMDCDDFAALLYGRFAGLVWTNLHAMCWFIDELLTFWWIEPQSGQLSRTLEGWQGSDVRFFLGR